MSDGPDPADAGSTNPDADAAVVLVHGFGSGPDVWRGLTARLREHDYRVISVCLPGHGGVPPALRDVHWTQWTAAVAEALERARAEHSRVFVVGHSLGATITLYLAASANPPDAAVLMSPSIDIGLRSRLLMGVFRLIGRRTLPWRRIGVGRPTGIPQGSPDAVAMPLAALRTNLALKATVAPMLPAVRCPVTIVSGARDPVVSPAEVERIAALLPGPAVPVHVLPRAGHTVQLSDDRDEAFRVTLDFLAAATRPARTAPLSH